MTLEHFPPPARIAALLGILLLSACGTEQIDPPFYRGYRDQYAITAEELKTLQFYISGDVLAHAVDASGGVTPEQVVIVKKRTPGLVREVGPNWLRVAFTEGGEGVLFRLRSDRPTAVYALATRTADGSIALVSDLRDPVLIQGERRYRLIQGADVYLIVSAKDLGHVIESRPHVTGLEGKK